MHSCWLERRPSSGYPNVFGICKDLVSNTKAQSICLQVILRLTPTGNRTGQKWSLVTFHLKNCLEDWWIRHSFRPTAKNRPLLYYSVMISCILSEFYFKLKIPSDNGKGRPTNANNIVHTDAHKDEDDISDVRCHASQSAPISVTKMYIYRILYYIILHYIILYYITLYYIILLYIILHYIILYYIILYHIILYICMYYNIYTLNILEPELGWEHQQTKHARSVSCPPWDSML